MEDQILSRYWNKYRALFKVNKLQLLEVRSVSRFSSSRITNIHGNSGLKGEINVEYKNFTCM